MPRPILFLLSAILILTALPASDRTTIERLPGTESSLPKVKGDKIYTVHLARSSSDPFYSVYSLSGELQSRFRVDVPGALEVYPGDLVPLTPNGGYVVSLVAKQPGKRSALLAFVNAQGQTSLLVKTTPFAPAQLVATDDGTIWAFGLHVKDYGPDSAEPLMYRFRPDGTLLGKSLPRNQLGSNGEWTPVEYHDPRGLPFLVSNGEQVSLWVSQSEQWVDFKADGEVHRVLTVRVPPVVRGGSPTLVSNGINGVALTRDGSAYARLASGEEHGIYRLDRDSQQWIPFIDRQTMLRDQIAGLWGASGDHLVVHFASPRSIYEFAMLPLRTGSN